MISILAALFGILFLAASTSPRTATTRFTLQPGAGYYTHYPFDTASGGTITVAYAVDSGTVVQYVLTEAEHQALLAGQPFTYLAMDSGSGGSFSATLQGAGSYEVVSVHGSGYENTVQTGTHTMTINALAPTPFYAGVFALVLAVILLVVGLWLRSRPEKHPPVMYAPPYVPAPLPGTTPSGATGLPGPPGVAPSYGTLLVTLENRAAAAETVQILVNGAPAVTLPVPAGGASQATLHPALLSPWGTTVRVEAVTSGGSRAGQDVTLAPNTPVPVTLRIG